MTPKAALLSLATATPPHELLQSDAQAIARDLFAGRYDEFERLSSVFANTGIRSRRLSQPLEWYFEPRGWPERTAAYLETAESLFVQAASKALDEAGLTGADIDTVVTVSSTGIATPSLEARVLTRMGFRSDISRVPVFGLGCAGGVSGLSLAARLARAEPGSNVLMATIELFTLAFRLDELTKANVVATALFGDGAAACVLRTGSDGAYAVEGAGEHIWPDTLDIMGWNVDPLGFGVIFAQAIPPFVRRRLGAAADGILRSLDLQRADVGRFVCHPGGAKVLTALEGALGLNQGELDVERDVLAEFGNMSAPTVLFVLERVLKAGLGHQRLFLSSLGPGFTASGLSLVKAA
ncbi:MAG: type III polyketide synthase [Phenylobacterium sp.]